MSITAAGPDTIGARVIGELQGVRDVWPRGERLESIRAAGAEYKQRFSSQGQITALRTVNIAAAPYPVQYAFGGAVLAPHAPMISIVNRMVIVQYQDWEGTPRTLVWEPTIPAGSLESPFYHGLEQLLSKVPGGTWLTHNVFTKYYHEPEEILGLCGVRAEDVDYVSFDHLHVQDVRMILGSEVAIPGEDQPREPLFPNAKLIAHRKEVATLESTHPMQWAWYVDGGLDGVSPDRLVLTDGDVELGPGISLIWTPGHTDGNHSLLLGTPDGAWISSENGVSADNWHPELSRIPGVRRWAEFFGREVVLNSNTLEDSIDQYDSMILEKTLADPSSRNPNWRQVLPSSELAQFRRQWPVLPTLFHGELSYGRIV
jgi:hypothetical protein